MFLCLVYWHAVHALFMQVIPSHSRSLVAAGRAAVVLAQVAGQQAVSVWPDFKDVFCLCWGCMHGDSASARASPGILFGP